jgi:tripartite-type tricarboxylate transporter receptor subunit TctC
VRALSTGLASGLGQQFIVENRVGGSGAVGTASVARAEADGYTLLFAPALVLSVLPQARNADAGYKPDSLVPVCQTFINTMGLVVRPDSPIKTIADLMTAANQRPGQLNYGHPGVLTIPQLAMEEFQQTAGIEIKDIPFRSGPQSITELLGGRLDVVSIVMGTEVGQNIRVIGVFSEKRIATFPEVPTVKEQGYDVTPASFGGLLAPLGTPPAIVSKLSQAAPTPRRTMSTSPRQSAPASRTIIMPTPWRSGCVWRGTSRARRACSRVSRRNEKNPGARPGFSTTLLTQPERCLLRLTGHRVDLRQRVRRGRLVLHVGRLLHRASIELLCCGAITGGLIAASLVQRSLNSTRPSGVYSLLRQVQGPATGRATV